MNRILTRVGVLLAIICVQSVLCAQWRGLRTKHLGPAEGLNMRVNNVVQGAAGFVYMGGTQGLVRYDGSEFELFAHNPEDSASIGPGEVYNLMVGSDSLIWIALRYGGLNSFDPKSGKFHRYPLPKLPYFMTPTAHGLLEDEDGCLWVGGHHFQLLCFDRITETFTAFQPDWIDPQAYGRRLSIKNIIQDRIDSNLLWLSVVDYQHDQASGYGNISFNKRTQSFVSYRNGGSNEFQDSLGNLYGIRSVNAITKFSTTRGDQQQLHFKVDEEVGYLSRGILQVRDKYWVTTGHVILSMDDTGSFEILHELADNETYEFFGLSNDERNNIWIASSQGVVIVNPRDQHMRYFSLDQFGDQQRVYPGRVAYDSQLDILYLSHYSAASENRVYRIPLNEDNSRSADFIETQFNMYGLAVDADDKLWLAGNGGLHEIDDDGRTIKNSPGVINEVVIPWLWNLRTSSTGWIAGAGDRKFIWFHPEGINVREITVDDLPVWPDVNKYDKDLIGFSFSPTKEHAYLISSVIHKLDLRSGKATLLHFDKKFNPNGQPISDAIEDAQGNLWIAGVEFTGKFNINGDSLVLIKRFTVQDGLASSEIHELFADKRGRVWFFTTNGINCIEGETNAVRYFGANEGLPDIYIDPRQIIETPDGRIVTVNSHGIIVFHPDSLWNSLTPRHEVVAIKAIRINGENITTDTDVNYLHSVSAPLGNNVIDIRFQGLAFPDDKRLTYSYRLSSGSGWIDIGHNKLVTLPALSPGNYTFEVKAGSPSSIAPVRELLIHIPTPYYRKTWFIAAAGILLMLGVYFAYMYRVTLIKKQEEGKTEVNKRMAELELKALRSQINPHFMFNSLNSIKDFILQSDSEKAAEYLSDFAHLIRRILQHSREKKITLKEELETLTLYIDLEQLRFESAFDFNCIVDEDIDLEELHIPPMLLQPYIENAIWHGLMHKKEKGSLTLSFARENKSILCVIDDDGIGRDRSKELKSLTAVRYKSMGMGITKDRIDILNKMSSLGISVSVEDKRDESNEAIGTRITLRIPAE